LLSSQTGLRQLTLWLAVQSDTQRCSTAAELGLGCGIPLLIGNVVFALFQLGTSERGRQTYESTIAFVGDSPAIGEPPDRPKPKK
jgi:hypothetical protein